ncbi:Alanine racemase [bioreactor metagenome]|uniref:Alanine racemase n=1 Tax=bioreactor metagenome TaxID=1076179 RepID=A0A645JF22_9ZZZZ
MLSWKTAIIHIKTIQPGETVSYGRTFTAARPTRIATLPVGYGDGYKRPMSGKAQVLIGGKRAPVVGRICMDQCMADVTEIPAAEVGSEVVLLGRQGEGRITADEMAAWADTISYEILLSINQRVPRIYIDEKE